MSMGKLTNDGDSINDNGASPANARPLI